MGYGYGGYGGGFGGFGCGCDYPSYVSPGYSGRNDFILIVVLFILLIIVGASCFK